MLKYFILAPESAKSSAKQTDSGKREYRFLASTTLACGHPISTNEDLRLSEEAISAGTQALPSEFEELEMCPNILASDRRKP
jgi:hypothetical protein